MNDINAEPPCRVRSFWGPDRKLLISVYVTETDITLMDDNGDLYEPTGPEKDMTKQTELAESFREMREDLAKLE